MQKEPDELIAKVNILARNIQHDLDEALAPTGLNASNYYFILKLGTADEMSQEALFKMIHLDPSNVTRRLAQLVTFGLVVKRRSDKDKRAWVISLTPKGRKLVPRVAQIVAGYEEMLTEKMHIDNKTKFGHMLDQLIETEKELEF
ncbi:MarR family transcriptional regulator [Lacticaseibacillus casei]|jgi:MarR family transcriptional regulator for hemolysin|uniref:MarR family transcriptional regulator n=1 Tax=Lacticaseibacillus huelsenbergensis TaxID=3035291 RepID=A0ABY8DLW4_9LACO|nr:MULTISPECIES: MarR family transcriptional regulator [Lacticaseibacillus]MDG3061217.1 MarR family transcriptional regulator [Lacticaseibacillus sp. BCRC 81376]QVI36108.1 MarR family transcriptional regulator [Lacticaseibacillus casei]QXG60480.1 MarR family transcriptional regulator [Lacticaseibacillus casei]WFB37964.1 MarR family transcriptional regulator [Lacticaseibacillus huelsenbergensis]WFB42370.1 MarR family transcriptional regulator [Lacticaseibacillus huelsenbergensis]